MTTWQEYKEEEAWEREEAKTEFIEDCFECDEENVSKLWNAFIKHFKEYDWIASFEEGRLVNGSTPTFTLDDIEEYRETLDYFADFSDEMAQYYLDNGRKYIDIVEEDDPDDSYCEFNFNLSKDFLETMFDYLVEVYF